MIIKLKKHTFVYNDKLEQFKQFFLFQTKIGLSSFINDRNFAIIYSTIISMLCGKNKFPYMYICVMIPSNPT